VQARKSGRRDVVATPKCRQRPGPFEADSSCRLTGGDPYEFHRDIGESRFPLASADISPAVIDSDPISS